MLDLKNQIFGENMNQKLFGSEKPRPLKRGRPTKEQHMANKALLEQYYHSGKAAYKVAEETGFNRKTVNKHYGQLYREDTRKFYEKLKKK